MDKKYMVSMYDPFVDAYRQVPVEQAKRFLDEVEELRIKIESVEEEKEKDELFAKHKAQKNEQS